MKTTDKESTFEAAESSDQSQLAIHGGPPVRTRPLPLEFGRREITAHHKGEGLTFVLWLENKYMYNTVGSSALAYNPDLHSGPATRAFERYG